MPAFASTIFKIRANEDFIAPPGSEPDLLSFCAGQPFYALATDYEKGYYFVSTKFSVPFARTAVTGLVPIRCFSEVALNAPSATMVSRKKARVVSNRVAQPPPTIPEVRKQSPAAEWGDIVQESVLAVQVLSCKCEAELDTFSIKVIREQNQHIIYRTSKEVNRLHMLFLDSLGRERAQFAIHSRDNELVRMKKLERYLNQIISVHVPHQGLRVAMEMFFNPKDTAEYILGQLVLRRDSGISGNSSSGGYGGKTEVKPSTYAELYRPDPRPRATIVSVMRKLTNDLRRKSIF